MKQIIAALSLVTIITTGTICQKEENNNAISTAEGKLLTSGSWKRIAGTMQVEGQPEEDTWSNKLDCVKDNLYIFHADQKYTWDEGATKCSPDAIQSETIKTWELREGQKILVLIDSVDFEHFFEITELSATRLQLKSVLGNLTYTDTYSH